jgi:UDP-N-acetyl-2-amino-2-deoxyglucuronate dehydrogenase
VNKRGIAVIGAGMGMKPHGLSLLDLRDRVEVVGMFSRSETRRAEAAATYGFPTTEELERLIADPRVDIVLILTPPAAHLEIVRLAAAAGKHILLEKPVDTTTDRAREIVALARQAGVRLGIVLQHRTRPGARHLRQLIDSGALGQLATASASIRWWRAQSYYDEPGRGTKARDGGGVLLTQAIHALDLFLSLTGPAAAVSAMAATSRLHRMECEDVVAGAVRFASGAIGAIDATTASYPGFPERLEFVFDQATAVLSGEALTLYRHDGSSETLFGTDDGHGGGADPMGYSHVQHRAILADFLDALDQEREPIVTGAEALNVHLFIDALLRSAEEQREVPVDHI